MKTWIDNIMFVCALRTELITAWSAILTCNYWLSYDVGLESETGSRPQDIGNTRIGLYKISWKLIYQTGCTWDEVWFLAYSTFLTCVLETAAALAFHPRVVSNRRTGSAGPPPTATNVGEIVLWCDGWGEEVHFLTKTCSAIVHPASHLSLSELSLINCVVVIFLTKSAADSVFLHNVEFLDSF